VARVSGEHKNLAFEAKQGMLDALYVPPTPDDSFHFPSSRLYLTKVGFGFTEDMVVLTYFTENIGCHGSPLKLSEEAYPSGKWKSRLPP
jgi:hypothetical protein